MEMTKSYITEDLSTLIRCPVCTRHKVLSVSRLFHVQRRIKFNVKCPCGNFFTSILERRNHPRKLSNLFGIYESHFSTKKLYHGFMIVRDLSVTGLKLETAESEYVSPNEILIVQFHLDNNQKSFLRKKVIVKYQNHHYLGTEFASTETTCKAIASYLMN